MDPLKRHLRLEVMLEGQDLEGVGSKARTKEGLYLLGGYDVGDVGNVDRQI